MGQLWGAEGMAEQPEPLPLPEPVPEQTDAALRPDHRPTRNRRKGAPPKVAQAAAQSVAPALELSCPTSGVAIPAYAGVAAPLKGPPRHDESPRPLWGMAEAHKRILREEDNLPAGNLALNGEGPVAPAAQLGEGRSPQMFPIPTVHPGGQSCGSDEASHSGSSTGGNMQHAAEAYLERGILPKQQSPLPHRQFGLPYMFDGSEAIQPGQQGPDYFAGPQVRPQHGRRHSNGHVQGSAPASSGSVHSAGSGGGAQRRSLHQSQQPWSRLPRGSRASSSQSTSSGTSSAAASEAAAMQMAATHALAGAALPQPAHHSHHLYASRPPMPQPTAHEQMHVAAVAAAYEQSYAAAAERGHPAPLHVPSWARQQRQHQQHQRRMGAAVGAFPQGPPPVLAPLPLIADNVRDAPDLERFVQAAAPQVPHPGSLEALAELTLWELWRWYEQPSLFGLACKSLGGPRGPSTAHFVPYLSAVQLFEVADGGGRLGSCHSCTPGTPCAAGAAAQGGSASGGAEDPGDLLMYPLGLDTWPAAMRRRFAWSDGQHVGDRPPLHQRVQEVCGGERGHPLVSSRLRHLHPYSWYAVAWYPLCRIPDAPLAARFLTFHSIAPLWEAASAAHCRLMQQQQQQQAAKPSYKSALGVGDSAGGSTAAPPPAAASRRPGGGGVTPTGVCSFPCSPAGSEAGTRTASSRSAGGSNSTAAAPASCNDSASAGGTALSSSSSGSLTPPEGSDAGDDRPPLALLHPAAPLGADAAPPPLELPAVGLHWHLAGCGPGPKENWDGTLVLADVAPGRVRAGDALPGGCGARVAGVWHDVAVVQKDYPVAKGGPMSWEIQLEELEEGARRLAMGQGLRRPTSQAGVEPTAAGCCCPDYDFFASRHRR